MHLGIATHFFLHEGVARDTPYLDSWAECSIHAGTAFRHRARIHLDTLFGTECRSHMWPAADAGGQIHVDSWEEWRRHRGQRRAMEQRSMWIAGECEGVTSGWSIEDLGKIKVPWG